MAYKKRNNEIMDLGKFTKQLKKASSIVRMNGPDYILAPVAGSVPLVDMLHIVDRKFPIDIVEYIPNSSRFKNRTELMNNWYKRFYDENEHGGKMKIICLDEVLSGSSAVVGYNQFMRSLEKRAITKAKLSSDNPDGKLIEHYSRKLNKNIKYNLVGFAEKGYDQAASFRKLERKDIATSIYFDEIPTIDNVAMNTIRFKEGGLNKQGRMSYLPIVERFDITDDYMDLLQSIAGYSGVDPKTVGPINLGKIKSDLEKSI